MDCGESRRRGARPTVAALWGRRDAFTLLEVLLALALSSLVLIALVMAIDFQFRVVEVGRHDVEDAQLARVLLHRMADDLRTVVTPAEKKSSSASSTTGTSSSSSSGESDSKQSSGSQSETGTSTDTTTSSSLPALASGMRGGSNWIEIGVSRIGRIASGGSGIGSVGNASMTLGSIGLRKVRYYAVASTTTGDESGVESGGTPTGLLRSEADAAATAWNPDQGSTVEAKDWTILAPEVDSLTFRYSDGSDWADTWDSDTSGSLPVAVEITITFKTKQNRPTTSIDLANGKSTSEEESSLEYCLSVDLPSASASSSSDSSTSSSDESDSSSTNSGGGT